MSQLDLDLEEEDAPIPVKKYTLNQGQQEALDWFVPFCLGEEMQGYEKALLQGYAGTGKTFVINRIIEAVRLVDKGINFGMTAPTHKAVKVLRTHSEIADLLDFGTIHSFLGLKQVMIQQKDGTYKMEYKPDFLNGKPRRIDGVRILIVDESSMLPDELFHYIEDEQRRGGLRVIYMGDEKQIPPVGKKQETGESNAIPFIPSRQKSHRIKVISLTEPQRQAKESPIIMYSVAIREQCTQQKVDFDFTEEMKPYLEKISPYKNLEGMRTIFRQYFCTPEFEADPDYVKVISFQNKNVDYFNREIRLLINKVSELPRIIEDEKLIMTEPLLDKEKKILLANNDEVRTENVQLSEMDVKYKLYPTNAMVLNKLMLETGEDHTKHVLKVKTYLTTLVADDGRKHIAHILHEDSEKEFNDLHKQLLEAAKTNKDQFQKKTLWHQYYKITEQLAWVNYNYAITAHKSQGSTYDYCISMEWDIETVRDIDERNRIRYVAATRARHKLFVIK